MKLLMICLITCVFYATTSYCADLLKKWSFVTSEDGISVYSQEPQSGTMPFKSSAMINSSVSRLVAVLKDHKNKYKWAPKLAGIRIHQKISQNEFVFSEYYKTPWPSTDREFLLKGHIKQINSDIYEFFAKSVQDDPQFSRFANPKYIQANVEFIKITLTRININQTKIDFEFHGDMKGWMPLWLMNLIQKKWPLRFIQGLRKYSSYPQLK